MSNDTFMMWYWGITGFGIGFLSIFWNGYFLIKLFFDRSATSDQFYDATLQLFGMPIAIAMFLPMVIYLAVCTSPIWITCYIRNGYMKNRQIADTSIYHDEKYIFIDLGKR